MPTIVTGAVPAEEFALSYSLEELSDPMFEIEQIVCSGDDAVMPMLWARGASRARVEETLADDPTVANVSLLGEFDEAHFFWMEWVEHVDLVIEMLTHAKATILDAVGLGDRWKLRVLYTDRSLFSQTHEFCEDHGLTYEVESIRELDGEPSGRYGLTPDQQEVLAEAAARGYFEVPRDVTLAELAEDLDVSHQALSEQLRRAMDALVEDTLTLEAPEAE